MCEDWWPVRDVGTGIARPGGRGRPPLQAPSDLVRGKFILYYFFFLYSFSPILYLPTRTTIGRPYEILSISVRGCRGRPPGRPGRIVMRPYPPCRLRRHPPFRQGGLGSILLGAEKIYYLLSLIFYLLFKFASPHKRAPRAHP